MRLMLMVRNDQKPWQIRCAKSFGHEAGRAFAYCAKIRGGVWWLVEAPSAAVARVLLGQKWAGADLPADEEWLDVPYDCAYWRARILKRSRRQS